MSIEYNNNRLIFLSGSHDSFSYTIKPGSRISPDEPRLQCFENCYCFSSVIKRVIFHWTLTQSLTCTEQLDHGIRYFDFRIASQLGSLTPYIVHGMYGCNVFEVLKQLKEFLLKHDKEIILLDFQHFYNFTHEYHIHFVNELWNMFGNLLCPFTSSEARMSLSNLWRSRYQVILFYRYEFGNFTPPSFVWPSRYIPNPWPETDNPLKLYRILEANYNKGRSPYYFYVTQGILTPDIKYILLRLYSTLKRSLAPKSHRVLQRWLKDKKAGSGGINIVISDFVEMKPYEFASRVISLNYN